MKKYISWLLLLALLFALACPALAVDSESGEQAGQTEAAGEGGEKETDPETRPESQGQSSGEEGESQQPGASSEAPGEETPQPQQVSEGNYMKLDTEHVYSGMAKAYKDGYIPTVSGGKVSLVLPVIPKGKFIDDECELTVDLGGTNNSPFVYGNYRKTLKLNSCSFEKQTVEVWLASVDIPLASGRNNGVYQVTLTLKARTEAGMAVSEMFAVYVTITDGKDPNAVPVQETAEPEEPLPEPKVIIKSSKMTPEQPEAGQEVTLTVTVQNTSEAVDVYNMTATASCDSLFFTGQNDSDVTYIGRLNHGAEKELVLKYKTDLATPEGKYSIRLNFAYENEKTQTYQASGAVTVKVNQPLRLQLNMPKVPDSINAGETFPMSFQVLNLSRGTAYNVRCEISGNGLLPNGTAFIGNLQGGSEGTGTSNVFAGSFQMTEGYLGDEKYGWSAGTVTLIYENEDGTEFRQEDNFGITINPPVITAADTVTEEEPVKTAGQWWISIAIGAAVLLAAGAAFLVIRLKRRRL